MTDIKIAFMKDLGGDKGYIVSCSCKTVRIVGNQNRYGFKFECEGCGNTERVFIGARETKVSYPLIELLESSGKGFKAKRTNLTISHDDDYNIFVKKNMIQVLKYDLANKKISLYRSGKTHPVNERTFPRFFTGVDDAKFMSLIYTDETKVIYDIIWNKLSYGNQYGSERRIHRGLAKFINEGHTYLQILHNAGFEDVVRFYDSYRYRRSGIINPHGNNPREILGVPKFLVNHIRDNTSIVLNNFETIKSAVNKVDGNKLREMFEIVEDESTIYYLSRAIDRVMEIHKDYGYKNLKKLVLYLFREIRITQGISDPSNGATLLRDYIRMSVALNQDYEKYPKSLKKEHDLVLMNYKINESEIKKKEFKNIVSLDSYKELEYKNKVFSIITPSEIEDLSKEGSELRHCVASYVSDVVDKKCKILFLRDTENIDIPLATIEVRGNNVRQARGINNGILREKEREFVAEWAKKKELELNYYY